MPATFIYLLISARDNRGWTALFSPSFYLNEIQIQILQLDLALKDEGGGDISSFITNGEWDLIGNFYHISSKKFHGFLA